MSDRNGTVRIAAAQPASFSGGEEHRNAAQACAFIDEAAAAGAAYVVFPEGYPGPYSGPMENDALDRVRERARARRVWVSAGRLEHGALPDTYHIAHLMIDDQGEIRARYRRVQPNHPVFNAYLMGGRHHVLPGDELMTADAPFGRIGLLICSELGRSGPDPRRPRSGAAAGGAIALLRRGDPLAPGTRRRGVWLPARAVARPAAGAVRGADPPAGGRLRVPLRAPRPRDVANRVRQDQRRTR